MSSPMAGIPVTNLQQNITITTETTTSFTLLITTPLYVHSVIDL